VNRGQVAAAARRNKERHPEHFCAAPGCLWRTWSASSDDENPCPRHMPRHNAAGKALHYTDHEGVKLSRPMTTDELCQAGE
jgi:hypothetical protein